mmetsp:Transcript_118292/g.235626  ORF Transcript_118292/g.235626 Transcript_118292/m.235626 type:complete len:255 (+) Transcript_118292:1735-2499(+)
MNALMTAGCFPIDWPTDPCLNLWAPDHHKKINSTYELSPPGPFRSCYGCRAWGFQCAAIRSRPAVSQSAAVDPMVPCRCQQVVTPPHFCLQSYPVAAVAPAPAHVAAAVSAPVAGAASRADAAAAALEESRHYRLPAHIVLHAGCKSADMTPTVACESQQAVHAMLGKIRCAQGKPKMRPQVSRVAASSFEESCLVLIALDQALPLRVAQEFRGRVQHQLFADLDGSQVAWAYFFWTGDIGSPPAPQTHRARKW